MYKNRYDIVQSTKNKISCKTYAKKTQMYMVLIDNGWMINEKEALNKSATVNV